MLLLRDQPAANSSRIGVYLVARAQRIQSTRHATGLEFLMPQALYSHL